MAVGTATVSNLGPGYHQLQNNIILAHVRACYNEPTLMETSSSSIFVTQLPKYFNPSQTLVQPFKVVIMEDIPDGTCVTLVASSSPDNYLHVKPSQAQVRNRLAEFYQLSFVDSTGQGGSFRLTIHVYFKKIKVMGIYLGELRCARTQQKILNNPAPSIRPTLIPRNPAVPIVGVTITVNQGLPVSSQTNYANAYPICPPLMFKDTPVQMMPPPNRKLTTWSSEAFKPCHQQIPGLSHGQIPQAPARASQVRQTKSKWRKDDRSSLSSGYSSSSSDNAELEQRQVASTPIKIFKGQSAISNSRNQVQGWSSPISRFQQRPGSSASNKTADPRPYCPVATLSTLKTPRGRKRARETREWSSPISRFHKSSSQPGSTPANQKSISRQDESSPIFGLKDHPVLTTLTKRKKSSPIWRPF